MSRLTAQQLRNLHSDDAGKRLFDGDGLYGRVRRQKEGLAVNFEFRYKMGGKARSISCGSWPGISLKEIRHRRNEYRSQVHEGTDPVEERRRRKQEQELQRKLELDAQRREMARLASRRCLADAVARWEKLELVRHKDQGREVMRGLRRDILPALGALPLEEIRRAMLISELDRVVARGSRRMANRLFSELKQFYRFAVTREWVEKNPLEGISRESIGGRETMRQRYLTEEEIVELARSLPSARLLQTTERAIWIMLSTCCRVGELSQARWEHVDLERRVWFIPEDNAKTREHRIFLSDFALEQFRALDILTGNSPWCFPARSGDSHIGTKCISKQIRDRTREAPLNHRSSAAGSLILSGGAWTPHDLRRTGATLMGELGVMGQVIERCLNHIEQNRMIRTYQRQELRKEQEEAWQLLGARLETLLLKA